MTAADYAWFEDRPPGLSESYCLTLARGLTPADFLDRLGARADATRTGAEALFEPSMDLWDAHDGRELLIGVTEVSGHRGAWALGLEFNGFLGITPELLVPLSAGTITVSHSRDIEFVGGFYWAEDGVIRLYFEPMNACYREGSTPDAVAGVMRNAGFDLRVEGEAEHCTEAALALAERITGVRGTPALLEESTYHCGIVPVP